MIKTKLFTIIIFVCCILLPIRANAAPAVSKQPVSTYNSEEPLYGIGSISKMYTTAAVIKLAEEGKINLDAPLTTYIPEFCMADSRYTQITPRMLLNHTSGLMGTTNHDSFTFGATDFRYHDSILQELQLQTLKAAPGDYGVYCNDGFTLAELLIERVSGMSYSDYLKQAFFEPLSLDNTFAGANGFDTNRIVPSYLGDTAVPFINCQLLGSGGIYSTASDVAKFGQIFTNAGSPVLSKDSVSMMAESNSANDSFGLIEGDKQFNYGLGWDCVDAYPYNAYDLQALTKGGSIIFQNSALVVLPQENISAAMTVSGGSGDEASYAIQDIIFEVLQEEGIIEEKKELSVKSNANPQTVAMPEEMRQYAGYYLSNQLLKVSFDNDSTLLLENTEDDYELVQKYTYIGDGKFAPQNGYYLNHSGELSYNSNGNKGYGTLFFRTESNGNTYIMGSSYETIYELGENASSLAFAQKLSDNPLSDDTTAIWSSREQSKYFLSCSVYNSLDYYTQGFLTLSLCDGINGYVHTSLNTDTAKIADKNLAASNLALPVMLGRDLTTYRFDENDTLHYNSLTYIPASQISVTGKLPEKLTIKQTEETHWYAVEPQDANRQLTISVPPNGAYYLYNKDGDCIASSVTLSKQAAVLLPENGYLLLAGEPGAAFLLDKAVQ